MTRYLLAPHSYACETGGYGVFLDLKHDKYTAVGPEDLRTLRTAVEGWTASPDAITQPATQTPEEDVLETLLKEGLITEDPSSGKPATRPALEEPTTSLWEFPRPWPHFGRHDLQNFFWAWAATTLRLRTLPIRSVVNRLREGELMRRRQTGSFEINKARMLSTIFFALQPSFYSAKDACLRNSLTALEFLGKYEVYPRCVFGVKMEPFAAHAWVQEGAVVLTDPIEHVRTFTPIMVV